MTAYRTDRDRRLTLAEYERLPDDDRHLSELAAGRLVREPRPGGRHAAVMTRLAWALHARLAESATTTVFTEGGFVLSEDPPTVRGPDVAVVGHHRLPPDEVPVGLIHGAPDVAFEIASPTNTPDELQHRVTDYLDAGTGIVCIVYPDRREAVVYRSRDDIRILSRGDAVDLGAVAPGVRLPLSELFG